MSALKDIVDVKQLLDKSLTSFIRRGTYEYHVIPIVLSNFAETLYRTDYRKLTIFKPP